MHSSAKLGMLAVFVLMCVQVQAQSASDLGTLKGLAPVSVLLNTDAGKAALGANYTVTGGIQTGTITQPNLLPFPIQQQQALQDAFITGANLVQLADGLGTTLGSTYAARFHYIDRKQTLHVKQRRTLAKPIRTTTGVVSLKLLARPTGIFLV